VASTYVTAGLGFLAGILWLDLMFDVQLLRNARADTRAQHDGLALVSAYYRQATGGARPMQLLVAVVMVVTLAAMVVQLRSGACPLWVSWASLIATAGPIALAWTHTLPNAIKLGATPNDASAERERLARSVLQDHVIALTGIASALALQLACVR
jgi:hypothetical protein